jgi:archaemetzincin
MKYLITILSFFFVVYLIASPKGFFNQKSIKDVNTIHIQPLGYVKKNDIQSIKNVIESFYGINCVIEPSDNINEYFELKNNMIDSYKILSNYKSKKNILVITNLNIVDENHKSIYGTGYQNGNTALISTYVMGEYYGYKSKNFNNQLKKTVLHELGHNFGLKHCSNKNCFMMSSHNIDIPIDSKKLTLCNSCKNKIY